MDVLKILSDVEQAGSAGEHYREIYPDDLDFFEVELATGDYDRHYIEECRKLIAQIRAAMQRKVEGSTSREAPGSECADSAWYVRRGNILAEGENPVAKSVQERIFADIQVLRNTQNYKTDFRKYINRNVEIDEAFIDKNCALFEPWELAAIVSLKPLSEDFLEKYFAVLDKKMIAKYQCFSEGFFMKHYAELDAKLVIGKGKNEWRKKDKRSRQLDIFLRLKGVKL